MIWRYSYIGQIVRFVKNYQNFIFTVSKVKLIELKILVSLSVLPQKVKVSTGQTDWYDYNLSPNFFQLNLSTLAGQYFPDGWIQCSQARWFRPRKNLRNIIRVPSRFETSWCTCLHGTWIFHAKARLQAECWHLGIWLCSVWATTLQTIVLSKWRTRWFWWKLSSRTETTGDRLYQV